MRQSRIEYDKCAAESEKEMKALRTELAKLGNRLGDFVQEMVTQPLYACFKSVACLCIVFCPICNTVAMTDKAHSKSRLFADHYKKSVFTHFP